MSYPNQQQARALDILRGIGWNWNLETVIKDTIRCWNVDSDELKDEDRAYSVKNGRLIATINSNGEVLMGEVTANGVTIDA